MEIGGEHSTENEENERDFTRAWINLTFRQDFQIFGTKCLRAFFLKGAYHLS